MSAASAIDHALRASRNLRRVRPPPRSSILLDASPIQLDHAVQQNQAEWIRFEGRLPGVELHDDADATWVCSGLSGRPNSVMIARFEEGRRAERRIRQILGRYAQLDASTVWWVGSLSTPSDLGVRLRRAGFHCFKHFPGMAIDLRRAKPAGSFRRPAGLRVSQITDFDVFEKHEHPFFGPMTTERRRNFIEGERLLCAARPQRVFAFLASMNGEPLGHAMVFYGAGVAGIFDVGVVRRARGRGIGAAVTRAALNHARRRGYRYAVLQASGDGERLYRRLGFEEVCRLSLWFHSRRHHEGAARF